MESDNRPSILDIGSGDKYLDKELFQYDVLVRLDADADTNPDYVHDINNPLPDELKNKFDLVYMSHVLEHIDRRKVPDVIKNCAAAVKNGGELWIVVPSLEWTIEQFDPFKGTSMVFHQMMFGGQQTEWDYHRSAFTMMDLRLLVENAGLIPRQAYRTDFVLEDTAKNEKLVAYQNVIIGMKHVTEPAIIVP